jgi:type II secretory pathway pseudopilin PulG
MTILFTIIGILLAAILLSREFQARARRTEENLKAVVDATARLKAALGDAGAQYIQDLVASVEVEDVDDAQATPIGAHLKVWPYLPFASSSTDGIVGGNPLLNARFFGAGTTMND